MAKYLLLALALFLGSAARTVETPADPTTFPAEGKIFPIRVVDYTFPYSDITNCYLLVGKTGQALLIDPADTLDMISNKKLLADCETGTATVIDAQKVTDYHVVKQNAYGTPTVVADPGTKREYYLYDQFRTTNTMGPQIVQALEKNKITLKYIVITHGHLDHFGALTYLKEKTGAEVIMHEADLRGQTGTKLVKPDDAPLIGYPKDAYRIVGLTTPVDRTVKEGDTIALDGMVFQVLHTPGHSPGSICLRTTRDDRPLLFSGDALFHWTALMLDAKGQPARDANGTYLAADTGRTNFVDGSGDETLLYRMVREKLLTLPENTLVYPGHGETTTIGEERKYSPAMHVPNTPAHGVPEGNAVQ